MRKTNLKRQNSSRITRRISSCKDKPPLARVYSSENISQIKSADEKFSVKKRDKFGNLIDKKDKESELLNDEMSLSQSQNKNTDKRSKSAECKNYNFFNKNNSVQSIVKNYWSNSKSELILKDFEDSEKKVSDLKDKNDDKNIWKTKVLSRMKSQSNIKKTKLVDDNDIIKMYPSVEQNPKSKFQTEFKSKWLSSDKKKKFIISSR